MRALLGCTLALVACFGVSADDKKPDPIDAKKLVGRWEAKGDEVGVVEFTKDGKVSITFGDKEEVVAEGTYKIDGDKLTSTLKAGGMEIKVTRTVTKLTDAELTMKDDRGKERTLVRLKDK
jgi:uncharacterized protein (TIGR03066 family)